MLPRARLHLARFVAAERIRKPLPNEVGRGARTPNVASVWLVREGSHAPISCLARARAQATSAISGEQSGRNKT